MSDLPELWKPTPFEGTDCFNIAPVGEDVDLDELGLEEADGISPQIARLTLVQGMSTVAKEGRATAGKFWHSIQEEALTSPIRTVCVFFHQSRWLSKMSIERVNLKADECRSIDAKQGTVYGDCANCEYSLWRKNGDGKRQPPHCQMSYDFYLAFPSGPTIMSFRGLSEGRARNFIGLCRASKRALWKHPVILESKLGGDNFLASIRHDLTCVLPADFQAAAKELHDTMKAAYLQGTLFAGGEEATSETPF